MSGSVLMNENIPSLCIGTVDYSKKKQHGSYRQSLKAKFDKEYSLNTNSSAGGSIRLSRRSSWCDAFSLSISSAKTRKAWKSGTVKLSQTFSNVRTTFGAISQKIRKSTTRREPLVNLDSPRTPATPSSRTRVLLGRTPTKLYSPFGIDTPGKENLSKRGRSHGRKKSPNTDIVKSIKIKMKHPACRICSVNNGTLSLTPEAKFSKDLLQAQIGIYEFHTVANRIANKKK